MTEIKTIWPSHVCRRRREVRGRELQGREGGYSVVRRGWDREEQKEPQSLGLQRTGQAGGQGPGWPDREEEEQACTRRREARKVVGLEARGSLNLLPLPPPPPPHTSWAGGGKRGEGSERCRTF